MDTPMIPPDVEAELRDTMRAGGKFHVELDGAGGRIISWKITRFGRLEESDWAPRRSLTIRRSGPQTDRDR